MKKRMIVLVIVFVVVISFSFAENNYSINPIVGTWINDDYNKVQKYGKFMVNPDYTIDAFNDPTRTNVPDTFTIIVDDSWSDAEGHIYYKVTVKSSWGRATYELWKLDNSQRVLESMAGAYRVEHPQAIKLGHASYNIHYRQK